MSWVRLWRDMPMDPKWRVIARRSGRSIAEVIAVFVFMMVNVGANAGDRGVLTGWSDEDIGAALDLDADAVQAIRSAMQGKVLDGDTLTGWEKRQPKREDGSAERSREWRAAQNRARTQSNAIERDETPRSRSRRDSESEAEAAAAADAARDDLRKRCEEAAGMNNLKSFSAVLALVKGGVSVDGRIIPMIRMVAAEIRRDGGDVRSWKYFTEAIEDVDRQPVAAPPVPEMIWIPEGAEFDKANGTLTAAGERPKKVLNISKGRGNWFPKDVVHPPSIHRPRAERGSAIGQVVHEAGQ